MQYCIVTSYEYLDADDMDEYYSYLEDARSKIEAIKETDFDILETSFEWFISQFWLANEIQFARYDGTSLPNVASQLLHIYTRRGITIR